MCRRHHSLEVSLDTGVIFEDRPQPNLSCSSGEYCLIPMETFSNSDRSHPSNRPLEEGCR